MWTAHPASRPDRRDRTSPLGRTLVPRVVRLHRPRRVRSAATAVGTETGTKAGWKTLVSVWPGFTIPSISRCALSLATALPGVLRGQGPSFGPSSGPSRLGRNRPVTCRSEVWSQFWSQVPASPWPSWINTRRISSVLISASGFCRQSRLRTTWACRSKRCTSGGTRDWVPEGSGSVATSGTAPRTWRRGSTGSVPGSVALLLDASYHLMAVGWQAAGRAGRAG